MPTQVVPINDLASIGLVEDTPSVSLPPNAFNKVENVRFRDGAIRKMTGEADPFITSTDVEYIAYWAAPSNNYWIVINNVGGISAYSTRDLGTRIPVGTMDVSGGANWNHTTFNGGFNLILNNGSTTPTFLSDPLGPNSLAELPNWDSYLSQETLATVEYSAQYANLSLGQNPDRLSNMNTMFDGIEVRITIVPRDAGQSITTQTFNGIGTQGMLTLHDMDADNPFPYINGPGLSPGDTVTIAIVRTPSINVTAGVIRAFGNLLVAGDLEERDSSNTLIRKIPGTIRTSDVAAPGSIPRNWNPFRIGANTADEFTLSSTGVIRDMVELQGVLYVYTDSSIHSLQQTGSPVVPFQITPVTDSYGVNNTDGVIEVDGKHIVVGSEDIYVFAGHPGSISSIADGRVRFSSFWDSGQPKIVRFQKYDELWFWKRASSEMYIWNYRDNTWTRRNQSTPVSVTDFNGTPVVATSLGLHFVDNEFGDNTFESYIERDRLAISPEFDTENLASMALMVSGNGNLNIQVRGSNVPGDEGGYQPAGTTTPDKLFDITDEYKQDIRIHGRFLNYRITHNPDSMADEGFVLSGMQFDIGKGGTR